ncbi:MAG: hypothetical protein WC314_26370 [Vulcanimicrobiota bacterium]
MSKISLFILLFFFALSLVGCDCAEGDTTSAFGPCCGDKEEEEDDSGGGGSGERLLVSDLANLNLRLFENITRLESQVETRLPLSGSLTNLTRPAYLTIHPVNGDLIVADEGTPAILFFKSPSELKGNVPPTRILRGPATELSGPVQAFVDAETDELYVLDVPTAQILVYEGASTIEGEVAPRRRLGGGSTGISLPSCFFFRASAGQVSVVTREEILTFDNFKTINGNVPPSGRFGGSNTTFRNVTYAVITSQGHLLAVDSGTDQILTFESFQFDRNNQAPTRIVGGANTGLTEPRQFELLDDALYLANGGEILVFADISTLEGNPFPTRRFSGLNPPTQTLQGLTILR